MLTSVTKTAQEYRAHAANAHALAKATAEPGTKKLYVDFERYWLHRALEYELAEWLGRKS